MYLVFRVETVGGTLKATELRGVSRELNWDTPFRLSPEFVPMVRNLFFGKRQRLLVLRHEDSNVFPSVAYLPLDKP